MFLIVFSPKTVVRLSGNEQLETIREQQSSTIVHQIDAGSFRPGGSTEKSEHGAVISPEPLMTGWSVSRSTSIVEVTFLSEFGADTTISRSTYFATTRSR